MFVFLYVWKNDIVYEWYWFILWNGTCIYLCICKHVSVCVVYEFLFDLVTVNDAFCHLSMYDMLSMCINDNGLSLLLKSFFFFEYVLFRKKITVVCWCICVSVYVCLVRIHANLLYFFNVFLILILNILLYGMLFCEMIIVVCWCICVNVAVYIVRIHANLLYFLKYF